MDIGLLLHMHGVSMIGMLIQSFRIIMQCSSFKTSEKILSNSEYLVKALYPIITPRASEQGKVIGVDVHICMLNVCGPKKNLIVLQEFSSIL